MAHALRPDHVLATWFEDVSDDPRVFATYLARWYGVDPAYDEHLRRELGAACEHAVAGGYQDWTASAHGRLALIVLLDQVTRNIHRGTARAFAGDARALPLALEAIDLGLDRELDVVRRSFFYVPLEHAEDLAVQRRYLDICLARERDAPPALADIARRYTAASRDHLDVIARFGRFPHRNAALGRASREDEVAWLAQGARHWGQGRPEPAD